MGQLPTLMECGFKALKLPFGSSSLLSTALSIYPLPDAKLREIKEEKRREIQRLLEPCVVCVLQRNQHSCLRSVLGREDKKCSKRTAEI